MPLVGWGEGVRFNCDVSFYHFFHVEAYCWNGILLEFSCCKDIQKRCFPAVLKSDQCDLNQRSVANKRKRIGTSISVRQKSDRSQSTKEYHQDQDAIAAALSCNQGWWCCLLTCDVTFNFLISGEDHQKIWVARINFLSP